ncbi:MAG: hypothetical protein WCK92_12315 [Bacteroidota bacterium]
MGHGTPMMQNFIIILISLLFLTDCFADEQRIQTRFESKNKEYSVQYKKSKWILTDKSGSVKYKFQDQGFTSMTLFASNNGQKIVVIDDFMEGHIIADRKALWIFTNGILAQTFKLKDLIGDTCNISMSIWYTGWCIEDFGFIDNQDHFSISTYELTDFVFDLNTGEIIRCKKPKGFDSETLIVFGEFRKGNGEQATMKIERYISGELQKENKVSFTTKYYGSGIWMEVLMIKNGIDLTPKKYRGRILINTCLQE